MRGSSLQPKYWLVLALFTLILAACSTAGAEDATDTEQLSAAEINDSDVETTDQTAAEEEATEEAAPSAEIAETEDSVVEEEDPAERETEESQEAVGLGTSEVEELVSEPTDTPVVEEENADDGLLTTDDRSDLLRQITAEWETDWQRHTVPYKEIVPVLFRDAIRSLDDPTFESIEEALEWLPGEDPVIVYEQEGEARAYPLRILSAHEIVNDFFGDVPIVITYCPLCNSALVFDRRFGGEIFSFGTSGLLRNSDLIMYDRTTETLWQQFTGDGIVGELAGERLTFLPSSIVSFEDFQNAFEDGVVLSNDTGFPFDYSLGSYQDYDQLGQDPYLFLDFDGEAQVKEIDQRLPSMERVVSVSLDEVDIAYPISVLSEVGVINDQQAGRDLVIFHTFGTTSAFYNSFAQRFDDVGATGVFDPNLNGQLLTFSKDGDDIVDDQTGSIWNILGQATEGPLAGESLSPILHGDHFWFSWAAFKPDTLIYEG